MEGYQSKRLPRADWATWADQVRELAANTHPDNEVLARACAGALCEAIDAAVPNPGTPLAQIITDQTIALVMHAAKMRGTTAKAINNLRNHLQVVRDHEAFPPTPTAVRSKQPFARLGRLGALSTLAESADPTIRQLARLVLADLQEVRREPWCRPVSQAQWTRLEKAAHRADLTTARWAWREFKTERIRVELGRSAPMVHLLPVIGSGSRLEQIAKWTSVPDGCDLTVLRGDRTMCNVPLLVGGCMYPVNSGVDAPPRRISKAEAKRVAEAARRLQASMPGPRSDEFEEILRAWQPERDEREGWDECRDLVHEIMRRATQINGEESFRKHLRLVAKFVRWTYFEGYEQDVVTLFTEFVIDLYIRHGVPSTSKSRKDYRCDLRNIGAHINEGTPGAPTKSQEFAHESVKPPYTQIEIEQILRLIALEPDTRYKRRIQVLVALGLGAGLSAQDIQQLSRQDIDDQGDHGMLITIQGPRARQIWLLHTYEPLLRSGLADLGPRQHVLGVRNMGKDTIVDAYKRIKPLGAGPDLLQGRMRNTWLAHLLCEPIPLWTILQASGLAGARSLTDIASFLEPTNEGYIVRGAAA